MWLVEVSEPARRSCWSLFLLPSTPPRVCSARLRRIVCEARHILNLIKNLGKYLHRRQAVAILFLLIRSRRCLKWYNNNSLGVYQGNYTPIMIQPTRLSQLSRGKMSSRLWNCFKLPVWDQLRDDLWQTDIFFVPLKTFSRQLVSVHHEFIPSRGWKVCWNHAKAPSEYEDPIYGRKNPINSQIVLRNIQKIPKIGWKLLKIGRKENRPELSFVSSVISFKIGPYSEFETIFLLSSLVGYHQSC